MMDNRFAFGANIAISSKSIDKKMIEDRALKRQMKNDQLHFLKAKALEDLAPSPKPGEQYRIVTEKRFNAYALILHCLMQDVVDEMYLAIYRIDSATTSSLIKLISDGKIKHANFIISNFFVNRKVQDEWAKKLLNFAARDQRCRCAFVHNHSKVCLVKSSGNYFVFEGSGNCSDNARIEQYLYENNRQTYDFHAGWMEQLIADCQTSSNAFEENSNPNQF